MLTEILVAACALFFLFLSYRYATSRPHRFPPGPPRLPIFGSYLYLLLANFKYTYKAAMNLSKWYKTDVVGFHVGAANVVAVHSAEAVKEVLTNTDFDGRPDIYLAKMRDPREELTGIFFREGEVWKEQRWFVLRYLRDFGFGRRFSTLEMAINEINSDMIDLIRHGPKYEHEKVFVKPGGYRILLPYFLNPFSVNSLFHCIFNYRIPRSDEADLYKLVQMGIQFQRNSDDYGKLISIIPWIRHYFPNLSSYNTLMEANVFIYQFFAKMIDHQIETYEDGFERNFIDLYIKEMKKTELDGNNNSSFNREQFIMAIVDFTFPAFTAVGVQMSFLLQYFLLYPDVQKKIQTEIDDVVGNGRLPTLDDREQMHYTEATIREILRIETLVPSSVPHKALVDTELMGYKIPKDTVVIPSIYAYHYDKTIWGDAQIFRPERFLDEQGHLCLKKDVSLPFGAGKRLCAGETFARNMLFLMTTSLCQNFNVVLGPGDKLPNVADNICGLITTPKDCWIQLEERVQ